MSKAFCTGSQVFGIPRPDSDIDLVLLLDADDVILLASHADQVEGGVGWEDAPPEYGNGQVTLRFGKLNLLCCIDENYYNGWKQATEDAMELRPLSKNESATFFEKVFKRLGLD